MATVTVSADANISAVTFAARDTLSLSSGVTLTIDETSGANASKGCTITVPTRAKLKIQNLSTSTVLKYKAFHASGAKNQVSSGEVEVVGDYIQMAVWDGVGTVLEGAGAGLADGSSYANRRGWTALGYDLADEPPSLEISKPGFYVVHVADSNLIAEGDVYSNNGCEFTVRKVYPHWNGSQYRVQLERTSGATDPAAGSQTFTKVSGAGSTFTSTWEDYYELWLGLADQVSTNASSSVEGISEWFTYDVVTTGNITFSNRVPPNGAKIRAYNILLGSIDGVSYTNKPYWSPDYNAIFKVKCAYMTGLYVSGSASNGPSVFRLEHVGLYGNGVTRTDAPHVWDHVAIAFGRAYSNGSAYAQMRTCRSVYLMDSVIVGNGNSTYVAWVEAPSVYLYNSKCIAYLRTGTSARTFGIFFANRGEAKYTLSVGGFWLFDTCADFNIRSCYYSDRTDGVETTTYATDSLAVNKCTGFTVWAYDLLSGGAGPRNTVVSIQNSGGGHIIRNCTTTSANSNKLAEVTSLTGDVIVARNVAQSLRGTTVGFASTASNVTSQNNEGPIGSWNGGDARECIAKLEDCTSTIPTNIIGGVNSPFILGRYDRASNLGFLGFVMHRIVTPFDSVEISDESKLSWDSSNRLVFADTLATVIFKFTGIRGVTGFQNVDPSLSRSSTGTNYTIDYSMDGGGLWKTANGANLSAEAVSSGTAFDLWLRVSRADGSDSAYLAGIALLCTVDPTYLYPLKLVSVKLRNLVVGSRYVVYRGTSYNASQVLASGEAVSDTVDISGVEYNADETITVVARKNSPAGTRYLPFSTQATLTASGADVFVSQVEDTIAV